MQRLKWLTRVGAKEELYLLCASICAIPRGEIDKKIFEQGNSD